MINQLLYDGRISIIESVTDWKEAVERVCLPLLEDASITPEYLSAIYASTEKNGPYYVVAPHIAMPHARPEEGVRRNALSLLVVKNGVEFQSSENDPVHIILLLAASDSNQHIELITSIYNFFSDEDDVQRVISAESTESVIEIIKKY